MIASRFAVLAYGLIAYGLLLFAFVQTVLFLSGVTLPPPFLPDAMDTRPAPHTWQSAVRFDVALMLSFAIQHNVMARPAFKRAWTSAIPAAAERSTCVLLSSVILLLLCHSWRPISGFAWNLTTPWLRGMLYGVMTLAWSVALVSTFLIDHLELFGLRQVWAHLRGRKMVSPRMHEPLLYQHMRHPLMFGLLLGMWSTPTMSWDHLMFAGMVAIWVLLSIRLEERDLLAEHGASYAAYRQRVPMLIPRRRTRNAEPSPLDSAPEA